MKIKFEGQEKVNLEVKQQQIPIQHYLKQPQRLVKAITDERLMQYLGNDCYQLKMNPLNFLDIYHFQPVVVLKVWTGASGTVYLQSESCEIKGIEYINRRFSLRLRGKLSPQISENKEDHVFLQGQADLTVEVDLPPPLWLTPKALLTSTGNSLLKGVLMRIKNRLMSQLVQDYYNFAQIAPLKNAENYYYSKT
ncbi:MAG: DUF1997 domain-containing protein [Cyanobacterium sp. T60_A2020_053]|nr:DUF1997 domain-containing protein [Cyanobacterium sp. T60_A2020_053]